MAMDLETFEFTIEDILSMHRSWITKLFVDDKKSEVEIMELLYERHLVVTLSQIHQCLIDWGFISPPLPQDSNTTATLPSQNSSDDWEIIPSQYSMSIVMDMFSASTSTVDLEALNQYTTEPLPSLPGKSNSTSNTSDKETQTKSKSSNRVSNDILVLGCGQDKYKQRVEATLDAAQENMSSLEAFLDDQQSHERLAMGLDRVPRLFCARANEGSGPRMQKAPIKSCRHGKDDKKKELNKEDEHEKKI